jgi:CHAD domain-containing protein
MVAERSTQLLKERCRAVFKELAKALAGEEEPLHQMRVAGRRLRVALPLLAQKPRGRRVRRALSTLRQLTRTAGSSRDLDVSVALFEDRIRQMGEPPRELASLLRRLRASRNGGRGRMAQALLDIEIARLRRDLRVIVTRKGEALFAVLQRLRRYRDVEGSEVLRALDSLGTRFDPDALHGLRIRARRLRYAAELSESLKGQRTPAPKVLKELQGALGRIHDHHVLATWFGAQAERASTRGDRELEEAAQKEAVFFLEKSRREHRTWLEHHPEEQVKQALLAMGRRVEAPPPPLREVRRAPVVDQAN